MVEAQYIKPELLQAFFPHEKQKQNKHAAKPMQPIRKKKKDDKGGDLTYK